MKPDSKIIFNWLAPGRSYIETSGGAERQGRSHTIALPASILRDGERFDYCEVRAVKVIEQGRRLLGPHGAGSRGVCVLLMTVETLGAEIRPGRVDGLTLDWLGISAANLQLVDVKPLPARVATSELKFVCEMRHFKAASDADRVLEGRDLVDEVLRNLDEAMSELERPC